MIFTEDNISEEFGNELKYLKLLSNQYPTTADACTEIINLQSILNLPIIL